MSVALWESCAAWAVRAVWCRWTCIRDNDLMHGEWCARTNEPFRSPWLCASPQPHCTLSSQPHKTQVTFQTFHCTHYGRRKGNGLLCEYMAHLRFVRYRRRKKIGRTRAASRPAARGCANAAPAAMPLPTEARGMASGLRGKKQKLRRFHFSHFQP